MGRAMSNNALLSMYLNHWDVDIWIFMFLSFGFVQLRTQYGRHILIT